MYHAKNTTTTNLFVTEPLFTNLFGGFGFIPPIYTYYYYYLMDNNYIKHNIINRLWVFDYVHILIDSNDHLISF